jgi:hypothetical protein
MLQPTIGLELGRKEYLSSRPNSRNLAKNVAISRKMWLGPYMYLGIKNCVTEKPFEIYN